MEDFPLRTRPGRIPPWVDRVALAVITVALVLPSLRIGFLSDDINHIYRAAHILTNLAYQYYRPLTALTFIFDHTLWGMRAFGFHLSNLVFHLIAVFLVYQFVLRITSRREAAFAGAFLFAVHPIHNLSVFWLSGRNDILCTIFFLLALLAVHSPNYSRSRKYLYLALLSFLAALASKEMALSLPLVVLVSALVLPDIDRRSRLRAAIDRSWPFFAVTLAFLLFRYLGTGFTPLTSTVHSNVQPLHLLKNLATFIGLLIVPGGHIQIAAFLGSHPVLFNIAAVVAVITFFAGIAWLRHSRLSLYFLLFILLTLLPVIRLAERWYLYLPSVGFCGLVGYLLTLPDLRTALGKVTRVALVAVAILYAFFLELYQTRWLDAGNLAAKSSTEIVRVLQSHHVSDAYLLTVPAELKQTPVLMFYLGDNLRWRAADMGVRLDSLDIAPVTYLSLGSADDFPLCRVEGVDDSTYNVIAGGTTTFEFPTDADVVSGKITLALGDTIATRLQTITVMQTNSAGRVVGVTVRLHDPARTILYYDRGRLRLAGKKAIS